MIFPSTFNMLKKIICFNILIVFVVGSVPNAYCAKAVVPANGPYEEVQVLKGDIQSIPAKNLKRVSITDPVVADINEANANAVDVIGIEPGQTILFIWDDSGKRTVIIRVVAEDMGLVKKRIQSLLDSAGLKDIVLKENAYEGKIVLTGSLPEDKIDFLGTVLEQFNDRIINMVQKESSEDLVQIDMQVTELSTTLDKQLGVDWGAGTATTALKLNYTETLPTTEIPRQTGSFKDLFTIGSFARTPALVAAINMMIEEGKAKVLSKPRLVVISGKEATFLVGGEVPIKTTTTNATGGQSQENVTFKEYGVSLAITPSIQDSKMVNILLSVEVSDIDTTRSSGSDVAFLTRSAHTQLLLEDHQTVVLAGMIKRRSSENTRRVPFISRIPLVGMLFRSNTKKTPDEETELVISITPTILRAGKSSVAVEEKPVVKQDEEARSELIKTQMLKKESVKAPAALEKPAVPVIEKTPAVAVPVIADAGNRLDLTSYADSVQKKIASAIAYPYEAQEKGWQGTVKLAIVVQKDGMIKNVAVKESSGYPVFDQDAINTAQILAPYAPFPAGTSADEVTLNIPIVYSLDAFLKNVSTAN
jgi:TonB family protein